jgi:biopolymer transport protein TolR
MAMRLGTRRPMNEINVTPLIDVVLVLLIIFMVLTPLADKQMFLRVPEYEPDAQLVPPEQVPPDQTILTVKRDGRVLLNRQEKSVEEAMAYLRAAYAHRPSKVLFFNAEDGVEYARAVNVIDLARQAGVNTVGMMTDPPLLAPPGPAAPGTPPRAP